MCLTASPGAFQTVQVLTHCQGAWAADLIRAKVVQGPGKHRSGRVPRQERGQVRHEPAAEGGAARLQQALQVLLAHCLRRNCHDGQHSWRCRGIPIDDCITVRLPAIVGLYVSHSHMLLDTGMQSCLQLALCCNHQLLFLALLA